MTEHDELDPMMLDALSHALTPATPPADLRARFMARASGPARFSPFMDRLNALFDLPEEETQQQIDAILDPQAEWEELVPGCTFRDFDGGPQLGDAHAGLIRVAPGAAFPNHRHVGEERVLMLQGRVRDTDGTEYRAGDVIVMPDGSEHHLVVVGDVEVIYAAVVVALEFTGELDDGAP